MDVNLFSYFSKNGSDTQGYYFDIYDYPSVFSPGKNHFRIKANKANLRIGSKVFIDVLDSSRSKIPYSILDIVGKDSSRVVSIEISKEIPYGNILILVGTYDRYGSFVISSRELKYSNTGKNLSEIIFSEPPLVELTEVTASYNRLNYNSSSLVNYVPVSGNYLTLFSPQSSVELVGSSRNSESSKEIIQNKNLYSKTTEKLLVSPDRSITKNFSTSNTSKPVEEYYQKATVKTNSPFFSKSMEGGELIVRSINLLQEAPRDYVNSSPFISIPDFSASIIKVLDSYRAEVDRGFYYKANYQSITEGSKDYLFTSLKSATDFTCSFLQNFNLQETSVSESFAVFDFKGASPSSGRLDKIHIKYKSVGSVGEYRDLGEFRLYEQNLLSDRLNYISSDRQGLIEKPVGSPRSLSDIQNYWVSSSFGGATLTLSYNDSLSERGINAVFNPDLSTEQTEKESYSVIKPSSEYYFESYKDSNYRLEFNAKSRKRSGSFVPQLDIYLSGSSTGYNEIKSSRGLNPIKSLYLGNHVNTVIKDGGAIESYSYEFEVKEGGYVLPVFVVRSGDWYLSDIKINSIYSDNLSPNHFRVTVPVNNFELNSDLSVKVEYYDPSNRKSDYDSEINGVYFYGYINPGIDTSSFVDNTDFTDFTSSIDTRVSALETARYGSITINYTGTLNYPTLVSTFSMPTSCSVENIFCFLSSSTAFTKVRFYLTSGSIYDAYDPRTNNGFDVNRSIGYFDVNSGPLINYTSSVFPGASITSPLGESSDSIYRLFASSSGATGVPDMYSKTVVGFTLRRV